MSKITVNGTRRSFDGDPNMPLLWYLRDELGLTGCKYGCGQGLCGACRVQVDGAVQPACLMAMRDVAGAEVVTIEGLDPNGDHPVQRAWRAHDVPQCGFCQSGQIMTAATLLADNPEPTDEEIVQYMGGVMCRCGTYQRILAAVKTAAKET